MVEKGYVGKDWVNKLKHSFTNLTTFKSQSVKENFDKQVHVKMFSQDQLRQNLESSAVLH